jgi:beta-N-acetylhexosaminidase
MARRHGGPDLSGRRSSARPVAVARGDARPSQRRLRVLLWLALLLGLATATIAIFSSVGHVASARHSAGEVRPRAPGSLRTDGAGREGDGADKARSTGALDPVRDHAAAARGSAGLARMFGQMIVARFSGDQPSASFLARVRAGHLGGVILFSNNLTGGRAAARKLIARLQGAASEGGNPPLLVMVDQEGGEVKHLAWAPPALAPSEMTSDAVARAQGKATGEALRSAGVNVDLAPVADVERVAGSFLGTRAFGLSLGPVASRACAFASGVAAASVAFTLKHFPGLGRALSSTDVQPVTIDASASALRADYGAYRSCGASTPALVMISSAAYPRLTGGLTPAVLSAEIYSHELGIATGGSAPPTISDDLQAPALANQASPVRRAIEAGLDLLLYATTEAGSADAYRSLLAAAESGMIAPARIEHAGRAIHTLKQAVAG